MEKTTTPYLTPEVTVLELQMEQSTTRYIIGGGKAQSYITTNDCEKH